MVGVSVSVSVTMGGAVAVVVGLIMSAMGVGVVVVVVEVSWLDVIRVSHAAVAMKCVTPMRVAVVVVRESSVIVVMS